MKTTLCIAMVACLIGSLSVARAADGKTKEKTQITLAGKVVDAKTGQGLEGFGVMVYAVTEGQAQAHVIQTGKDGAFETKVIDATQAILVPQPDEKFLLEPQARQLGEMPVTIQVNLAQSPGDHRDLLMRVKLMPVMELSGRVMNADGKPAPKTMIMTGLEAGRAARRGTCQSDKDGQFTIKNAPADRTFQMLLLGKGMSAAKIVTITAGQKQCDVTLSPTVRQEFVVAMDNGKAAPEDFTANAMLWMNDQPVWIPMRGQEQEEMQLQRADADHFALPKAIAGATYRVMWYEGAGYEPGVCEVTADGGAPAKVVVKHFEDDWDKAGNIAIHKETKCKELANYCLDQNDNILACDRSSKKLLKISPDDKLLAAWDLGFGPEAVTCRADGTIFVAGSGQMALLSADGTKIKDAKLPGNAPRASSAACADKDIFVCVQSGMGYNVYRFDDQFAEPALIIKGLRGCCGVMDIMARKDALYVAANCDFKIVKYDRDGKKLLQFGKSIREDAKAGFDGCCEPKAVFADPAGNIYTGESAHPGVKKFTADGTPLETVGTVSGIRGCVRVTTAVSSDGKKVYLLDTSRNIVRLVDASAKAKDGGK